MGPPIVEQGVSNLSAPFDEWLLIASYDTAAECERDRAKLAKTARSDLDSLRRRYGPDHAESRTAGNRSALMHGARCIASDDPRLK
jgi:hypothetical protein